MAGTVRSFDRYWGKAQPGQTCRPGYHLLAYHCLDVAAVAVRYLQRHRSLRQHLCSSLGDPGDEALDAWIGFWVALHDLGKFSEAFQSQRSDLVSDLKHRGPVPITSSSEYRHDTLGWLFWQSRLKPDLVRRGLLDPDWDREAGIDAWVRAVVGHHGQPPKEVPQAAPWDRFFHRTEDPQAIHAFVEQLVPLFWLGRAQLIPVLLEPAEFYRASQMLSWWMAGLTVLADWIGSNTQMFPYCDQQGLPLIDYWTEALRKADRALDVCGVLPSRCPPLTAFSELFPQIECPSPLQHWASVVEIPSCPQIHILEDVTGAGKTEAAVMLVHRLMAAGAADGFFIGLPTMATANAMYRRITKVHAQLFDGPASLTLPHSKDWLVEEFAASVIRSGDEVRDPAQADDTATARCSAWLADHRKRALLAPAGVGTVDQALLGALKSKHQSLRLLGLFRKVLVVDEVHACDPYMQSTLEELLRLHAQAGGSAILLSATLPQSMKQSLLSAYAQGHGAAAAPEVREQAFPLVSSWAAGAPDGLGEHRVPTRADVCRSVAFKYVSDEARVIACIERALAEGQCVAWIRNTVGDAVAAHARFASRLSPENLLLFHARFALGDRLDMEQEVLRRLGPASGPTHRAGCLLISTQVAEQSLDIDVDVLITDLAPVDRLLQRAGRLRRHVRDRHGRRLTHPSAHDERGTPCVWIHGPSWSDDPQANWMRAALPGTAAVYPNHGQLWLTARELRDRTIRVPDEVRRVVEAVYGDTADAPPGLQGHVGRALGQAMADSGQAKGNTVRAETGYARGVLDWLDDARVPSRLGEETVELLIGRWNGDALMPWAEHPDPKHAWAYSSLRLAARRIAEVPPPVSPDRASALAAFKASLPGQGKWCQVLVMEWCDGCWRATSCAPAPDGRSTRLTRWRYDAHSGLVEESPDQATDVQHL